MDCSIFTNARIWREGEFDPRINTILCRNGRIEEFFAIDDPIPLQYPIFDLDKACLYPGFIDTHTHSFEGGLYSNGLDLSSCRSIVEIQDAIRAKRDNLIQRGENMLIAWNLDEYKIKEKRFPTIKELDEVCNDMFLLLRRIDGHSCAGNSMLVSQMRIDGFHLPYQSVYRGSDNDRMVHWVHTQCNEETILNAYHRAAQCALKGGFTTIHTMIGDGRDSITHYALIRDRLSQFAVEYVIYPQSFNIDAALDAGAKRIGGCILADGSFGSCTAAVSEPYQGQPDNLGKLYHSDGFWFDFIHKAHSLGLQVAVHCIGDRAISQINNIYRHLHQTDHQDLRHQLIHCELTPDHLIGEITASAAVCVIQPSFDLLWGGKDGLYTTLLGYHRGQLMNRFRTMQTNGIIVTGSSDWYVTELDIRKGLEGAMLHHNPDERLDPSAAIDLYTKNAAYLSHSDDRLGKIEPGFQADFTILNHPISTGIDFSSLSVQAVIKSGNLVYASPAFHR